MRRLEDLKKYKWEPHTCGSSIEVTMSHIDHVDVTNQGDHTVPGAPVLPAINPAVGFMETHFPVRSPRSRRNQIRLKTREAKRKMPSVRSTNTKVEKKTNRSFGVGQRILTTLNSLAHTKDLLWYIILFLTIYTKRTYGAPILHQAFMPIAAYPTAWIPSRLTAPNLGTHSWNHMAGVNSSHSNTPTTTADISIPAAAPNYSGSSVEFPDYITILIATGSLVTMMTGITALLRRLLRRNSSSPGQLGYRNQEEEEKIRKILKKAVHLRSPMERLAVDNWSKRQDPFQL